MGDIFAILPAAAGAYVMLRSERPMRAGTLVLLSLSKNEKTFGIIQDCAPHDGLFYLGLNVLPARGAARQERRRAAGSAA